jgi:hypothetical protein
MHNPLDAPCAAPGAEETLTRNPLPFRDVESEWGQVGSPPVRDQSSAPPTPASWTPERPNPSDPRGPRVGWGILPRNLA